MNGISSPSAPALDVPARFMGLSIAALAVAALSAPWTLPLVQGPLGAFSLLALVHLLTLGFVGAMLIGASYQLVPVALGARLSSVGVARASFWAYAGGLTLFLGGLARAWTPALAAGGILLGVAFLMYAAVVGATWWRAAHHDVIAWHILLGLIAALAGMSLGVALAVNKGTGLLGGRLPGVLGAHVVMMLAGWVGLTFFGVAYRLVAMFTLAEMAFLPSLAWLELALVGGGTSLLALRAVLGLPVAVAQVGAALLLAGVVAFVAGLRRLYGRRMRRGIDVHMPFAISAAAMAIAAAALLLAGLVPAVPMNRPPWIAAGWLAIPGVAGTAIQGFFYKIATFLVWLRRYAPVAGTRPVPRLEDLYSRRLALAGWALWTSAVVGGAAVILLDVLTMTLVAVPLLAGTACFLVNIAAIARHWAMGGPRGTDVPHAAAARARPLA